MKVTDNYQVNYWAGGENYEFQSPKPKRSIKRKLSIVFSFVFVLAVTPSLIYALISMDFNGGREIGVASTEIHTPIQTEASKPEVHKVFIEEPKPKDNETTTIGESKQTVNETTVINNDSWWKITKRVCGKGNNYLFVKDQNNGKALFEGDTVTVDCEL